jgi:hypothetical protein
MFGTILGIGIGALATFFADPQGGQRRRAQLIRASRRTRGALDATARDLANRTSAVMAVKDRRPGNLIRAAMGRGRSRWHPSTWAAPRNQALAAAGLAATGLCIAAYARR